MGSRARLYTGQGISAEAPNSGLAYLSVDLHLIRSERHFWSCGFLYSVYASLGEETNSVASLPGWNTGPWVSLSTRAKEILSTWDFIHCRTLPQTKYTQHPPAPTTPALLIRWCAILLKADREEERKWSWKRKTWTVATSYCHSGSDFGMHANVETA